MWGAVLHLLIEASQREGLNQSRQREGGSKPIAPRHGQAQADREESSWKFIGWSEARKG